MAARFHTEDVVMMGIDVHDLDVVPTPCAVLKPFDMWLTNKKIRPRLTGYGFPLVQEGFKMYIIPHVPLIPPVTPKGWADLAWANLEGNSMCVFGVASVTSGGEALACSIDEAWGTNANCWSLGPLSVKVPTGITFSHYPLHTNPTDADIGRAYVSMAIETFFSTVFKAASKQMSSTEWVQKFFKNIVFPKVLRDANTLDVVDTELE